jgi:hypothetical protein
MRRVLLHGQCRGGLYPLPPSTSKFRKLVFSAKKFQLIGDIVIWVTHLVTLFVVLFPGITCLVHILA